jgi:hypothetical protein
MPDAKSQRRFCGTVRCVSDVGSSKFYAKDELHLSLQRDASSGFTFSGVDFGHDGSSDYEYCIGVEPGEFDKIRKLLARRAMDTSSTG